MQNMNNKFYWSQPGPARLANVEPKTTMSTHTFDKIYKMLYGRENSIDISFYSVWKTDRLVTPGGGGFAMLADGDRLYLILQYYGGDSSRQSILFEHTLYRTADGKNSRRLRRRFARPINNNRWRKSGK